MISFEDPVVKKRIQSNLKVRGLPWENPAPELLESITWLSFHLTDSDVITTLDDLAYFPNLEEFKIDGEYGSVLKDFSAITKLPKLKSLELISLDLTNIEDLSSMTQLTHLNLIGNKITDVSPLSNLTNLERLWLGVNNISDTSPLYSLMLSGCDIDLDGNPQTTVTAPTGGSSSYDAVSSASTIVSDVPTSGFPTVPSPSIILGKKIALSDAFGMEGSYYYDYDATATSDIYEYIDTLVGVGIFTRSKSEILEDSEYISLDSNICDGSIVICIYEPNRSKSAFFIGCTDMLVAE